MKLTEEQKKLVEENHNLIWGFIQKYNLDADLYDLVAIGLCEAAFKFDPLRGTFSTIAYRQMWTKVSHYFREMNAQKCVPQDMCYSYNVTFVDKFGHELEYEEMFMDNKVDVEEEAIVSASISKVLDQVSERDRTLFIMSYQGYQQPEIGRALGISQSHVSRRLRRMREMYVGA